MLSLAKHITSLHWSRHSEEKSSKHTSHKRSESDSVPSQKDVASPSNSPPTTGPPGSNLDRRRSLARRATSMFYSDDQTPEPNTDETNQWFFRMLTSAAHAGPTSDNSSRSDASDSDGLSTHVKDATFYEGDELARRIALLASNTYTAISDTPKPKIQPLITIDSPIPTQAELSAALGDDLTMDEKLELLIESHPLAGPNEIEKMIVEVSGGLWRDGTVILGVIHLTTHRIAFHASLPPLHHASPSDVIKAGNVMFSHVQSKRKQRVWLELTHEMLTAYQSSSEDGRTRPMYSYLLTSIHRVLLPDPSEPRKLRIGLANADEITTTTVAIIELDTDESAVSWHLDISKALFDVNRTQNDLLRTDSDARDAGISIHIPLGRIYSSAFVDWLGVTKMWAVDISRCKPIPLLQILNDSAATSQPHHTTPQTLFHHTTHPPLVSTKSHGQKTSGSAASSDASSDSSGGDARPLTIQLVLFGSTSKAVDKVFCGTLSQARERENIIGGEGSGRVIYEVDQIQSLDVDYAEYDSDAEEETEPAEKPSKSGECPLAKARQRNKCRSKARAERQVRATFALGSKGHVWISKCGTARTISTSGLLIVSDRFVCFWRRNIGSSDTKYRFQLTDILGAQPRKTSRPAVFGMALQITGRHDLVLEFSKRTRRDEAVTEVLDAVKRLKADTAPLTPESDTSLDLPSSSDSSTTMVASAPKHVELQVVAVNKPLERRSISSKLFSSAAAARLSASLVWPEHVMPFVPRAINVPPNQLRRIRPRHFVCLTIGSRGDVQPYISLALGLMAEGHRVTIVTHEEYKDWVQGYKIAHRTAGGDPAALMKLSVEHSMFSPQFFKESLGNFRGWLDDLLVEAWAQCQDADVLIESPSAMAGVHIAEALKIPYFRAFTMPWTRTTEYPHAFLSPPSEISNSFNYSTYVLFDNIFWRATSGQINRWRRKTLRIEPTDMDKLAQTKIPFLYNFSPSVVPKPLDWKDSTIVTGYWFLENSDQGWTPPPALEDFIARAKSDKKPLVYIGFGSIVVPDSRAMTKSIVKAVLKADVRAILAKGWSSRLSKDDGPDDELPPECYSIDKIPHDWLFPKCDALLHHGGSGTTGAGLRAGTPTIIKPWFGDQFFWATRVQRLGAGIRLGSLRSSDIAAALKQATSDRVMKEKATAIGKKIHSENGVNTAIQAIYNYVSRAKQERATLH